MHTMVQNKKRNMPLASPVADVLLPTDRLQAAGRFRFSISKFIIINCLTVFFPFLFARELANI